VTDPVITKYAEMISLEPSDISNYPLYRFIDKWYGVRYKWGGATTKGIDCSAFSQKLYSNVYNTEIKRTSKQQFKNCERFKKHTEASEGDLVFFRINRIRLSHVGVYLANGYFVHASRGHGVMISSLDSKYWRRRYAGCGRIEREDNTDAESDYTQ
jgi:lipoprotein Spr